MKLSYRYKLRLTEAQEERFREMESVAARFWNMALAHLMRLHPDHARISEENRLVRLGLLERIQPNAAGRRSYIQKATATPTEMQRQSSQRRNACEWMQVFPAHMKNGVDLALLVAWDLYSRGDRACPKFRRDGAAGPLKIDSMSSMPCAVSIDGRNGEVTPPPVLGTGPLRFIAHRPLPSRHTRVLFSSDARGFRYVTFTVEREVAQISNGRAVGLDVGVRNLVADSDGRRVRSRNKNKRELRKRWRLQSEAAKLKAGGSRRRRLETRALRIEARVNDRQTFHEHRIANYYSRFATVAVEDLNVASMTAAGGARKRGLNRALRMVRFGRLRETIRYKTEARGNAMAPVRPQYTSQTCSACGHVDRASRCGEAFRCSACGHEAHADVNAAKNILARAQAGRVVRKKARVRTSGAVPRRRPTDSASAARVLDRGAAETSHSSPAADSARQGERPEVVGGGSKSTSGASGASQLDGENPRVSKAHGRGRESGKNQTVVGCPDIAVRHRAESGAGPTTDWLAGGWRSGLRRV